MSTADSLQSLQNEKDREFRKRIFGANLFSNANLTFEPNLNIATPPNYVVGPGDELILQVFGNSEKNDRLKVTPEGFVVVQNVGPILVSGLTMDEAKALITRKLQTIYSGIASGNTHVQLLLGNIRSIQVMVIGEIMRPGSYTQPSLATVANALYVSGGPDVNGSFRDITVVRNGKSIVTFDLYDFLTHGSLAKNILLQDQDIVKVNPYQTRVELTGEVKHPAIFEAKEGEYLGNIIYYAGGYTSNAYKGFISAVRVNAREKEILTVPADSVEHYPLHSGDVFHVDSILDRYTNRVVISGAVFHPGDFALDSGMTVKDLINKYLENVTPNGKPATRFITTRFGNVLGSNGSVIPRFKAQIEKGGPITVTHPEITRYFMTIPEACQLVLEAAAMGKGGEIFVFDMGKSIRIADMARKMVVLAGLEPDRDIAIQFTGLRPGEKLYEEVLSDVEPTIPTYHSKIMLAETREYDFDSVQESMYGLIEAAKLENDWKTVRIMKLMVPEFVSNNSKFERLDVQLKEIRKRMDMEGELIK